MRFEYGRDNVGNDGAADGFRKCLSTVDPCVAADWANTMAVRVNLLARNLAHRRRLHRYQDLRPGRRDRRRPVQRPLQTARVHGRGAADESGGPKGALIMIRKSTSDDRPARQRGISLVLGLIMLVLLTLLAISAFQASNVNLRIAGNMQVRQETLAAAQTAIETGAELAGLHRPDDAACRRHRDSQWRQLHRQFHAGPRLQEHRRHPERRSRSRPIRTTSSAFRAAHCPARVRNLPRRRAARVRPRTARTRAGR